MGFHESRDKTLEEMIDKEPPSSWANTDFMKLVDAKVGLEVKRELAKLAAGISSIMEKIPVSVQKMIDSNEKLSRANSRYAKALCWLTAGLVLVGLLPYIEKLVKILH